MVEGKADGLGIVTAEFPVNYAVDLSRPVGTAPKADRAELEYFCRATRMLPTEGMVKATAIEITSGARSDLEKARGCGVGNIRFMLESKGLGGKCADLNALYVGLARAAGLSARDVYGIRIAKSELGYKSLGTSSENITKAQHCRAEVYIDAYGWVPVDPDNFKYEITSREMTVCVAHALLRAVLALVPTPP
jgi:hypothetical protein